MVAANKDKSTADTNINATGVSNFLGSKSGKAVTKTEVFGGRSILPMVSIASDRAMADAAGAYEIVVSRGGWPTVSGSRLARGKSGPDVITLRQRLAAEGYLNTENLAGDAAEEYSDTVMKAVARFQANHGLAITGKVDKPTSQAMNVSAAARLATLRANIPRMHEYSKDLGPRYIIVNVPALQLEAVNFNSVFSRHNIIAGQPSRPTPVTLTQISDINFNPYWNAPVSIVEKDILPRVRTEGTRVLRNMNMRIYDGYNGPEVDPQRSIGTMSHPTGFSSARIRVKKMRWPALRSISPVRLAFICMTPRPRISSPPVPATLVPGASGSSRSRFL